MGKQQPPQPEVTKELQGTGTLTLLLFSNRAVLFFNLLPGAAWVGWKLGWHETFPGVATNIGGLCLGVAILLIVRSFKFKGKLHDPFIVEYSRRLAEDAGDEEDLQDALNELK